MTPNRGAPSATLEAEIKQEARRLGFVLAGVTTPAPPPHATFFAAWLEAGRHGRMDYLAAERSRVCRSNPGEMMPGCKSVLVLAMPYSNPSGAAFRESLDHAGDSRGRVAAYAWGRDYHDVIPARLRNLVAFIEQRAGRPIARRCYTDTGPILERELAQRAGLGWIGKNTCLINPKLGSYFLLAEILLDLELQPDAALETDHCGSCTRCLQACPTECILMDRSIDAQHCISYLTIELKDAIPQELRARMGDWLFGCDICQMVCPWNRFAPPQGEPELAGTNTARCPDLVEQLRLSSEGFAACFRGSPLKRAKHRGFLRNAAVAAGNVGGTEVVPPLRMLAEQRDPILQEHASWALTQITQRNRKDA